MSTCISDEGLDRMLDETNSQKSSPVSFSDGFAEEQQYDSEFEQTNENYGSKVGTPGKENGPKCLLKSTQSSNSTKYGQPQIRPKKGVKNAKSLGPYYSQQSVSKRRGSQMSGRVAVPNMAVDQWEHLQVQLAEAHSRNVMLQKQLQDCRAELKTVQRQYKLQSARLNKAIGQEADLPRIIDRMTTDIRSLQARLRDKTSQYNLAQHKITELEHRIVILQKECDERQNANLPDDIMPRKKTHKLEDVLDELDREKKKVASLQRQLDVTTRSQKHQTTIANERIRQLRRNCRDLEAQLSERTLALQEKIKLLELHNIYSQRFPKSIPVYLPQTQVMTPVDQNDRPPCMEHLHHFTTHRAIDRFTDSRANKTEPNDVPVRIKIRATASLMKSPEITNSVTREELTEVPIEAVASTSCLNELAFEEAIAPGVESVSDTSPVKMAEKFVPYSSKDSEETGVTQLAELSLIEQGAGSPGHTPTITPPGDQSPSENIEEPTHNTGDHKPTEQNAMEQNEKSNGLEEESSTVMDAGISFTTQTLQASSDQQRHKLDSVESLDSQSITDSCSLSVVPPLPITKTSSSSMDDEERERERKRRLLMTLEELDERVSGVFSNSVGLSPEHKSSPKVEEQVNFETVLHDQPMEPEKEEGQEVKFDKRREQELWNELFGSSGTEKNSIKEAKSIPPIPPAPVNRLSKQRKSSDSKSSKLSETKQVGQQRRNEFSMPGRRLPNSGPAPGGRTSTNTQGLPKPTNSSIPSLPGLTDTNQVQPGRIHPKYAPVRPFRDEDDDSDLEQFQA